MVNVSAKSLGLTDDAFDTEKRPMKKSEGSDVRKDTFGLKQLL